MAYGKHTKVLPSTYDNPAYEINSTEWNANIPVTLETGENFVSDAEKSALHGHTNKTTLDQIGESAGNPTWNGGAWPGSASGVTSVNGDAGPAVVLDATDVGADPAGTAAAAVSAHESAPDPHPQYAQESALGSAAYQASSAFDASGTSAAAITTHLGDAAHNHLTLAQYNDMVQSIGPVASLTDTSPVVTGSAGRYNYTYIVEADYSGNPPTTTNYIRVDCSTYQIGARVRFINNYNGGVNNQLIILLDLAIGGITVEVPNYDVIGKPAYNTATNLAYYRMSGNTLDTVEFQIMSLAVTLSIFDFQSWVAGQIPWSKIDKAGAVASDIGAEPANSNIQGHIAASAPHAGHLTSSHIDTDGAAASLHHTIGTGATQAAAGNHSHTGTYEPASSNIQTHISATAPHTGHLTSSHVDTDASTSALHHTLGTGANQAAAGSHTHAQLHDRLHTVTSTADHTFPGGTTFLRADGVFATPAAGAATLDIRDEGVSLTTSPTLINFVGAGVTVTEPVADQLTVTIPGGGSGGGDGGFAFKYGFSTSTDGTTGMGAGVIQFDNATPANATMVYLYEVDAVGVTIDQYIDEVDVGDWLMFSNADKSKFHVYLATATFTSGPASDAIPIVYKFGTATNFADGETIYWQRQPAEYRYKIGRSQAISTFMVLV